MAAAMSGHQGKCAGQSNGDSSSEVRAASPVATATAAMVFWESGPMMSPLLAQSTDGLRQVLNKSFANTRMARCSRSHGWPRVQKHTRGRRLWEYT